MEEVNEKMTELLTLMTGRPSAARIALSLGVALGLAGVLWLTYRRANRGEAYQPKFAVTLVSLALLSTILMDLVQSNLALSLGMLGSLSIARFRTRLKDPRDIGFIFWAMAIGLAAATGCYGIGLLGSLVIGALLVLTAARGDPELLLVIRGSRTDLDAVGQTVASGCSRSSVKARNIMADSFELVYDVALPEKDGNSLIESLFALEGVDTVNLLAERRAA